ncbi:gliding motility-associated ABC transporter substrate-binding protein GldG [Riemerella columbipharyngis]|uniref:Gliding-associated putative ABC transporter substrate-binding component GldG n=1 Tax=Riemerella columbipharyngis TaxID=1071918 RepID=A0A1G6YS50_9FLAO|nr:gliding motility-associated ABC transporter substrate-binding protein GldG [Riemerella columbipharyngis]SDD92386.1 gliding-associated putative ABC transporter substrate-binding component GldG [Riemerella columbipharyngis]
MNTFLKHKILYIVLGLFLIVGTLGLFRKRFDLTQEHRYTLSDASVRILKSIKKPLKIEVYLDGDFPASFKQLQNETRFMLEEFKDINNNIDYKFIDPIATKISKDTLVAMGMQPSILPNVKDGKISEIVIFPYAAIKYNGYGISVPLVVQQMGLDADNQINKSIESLEYSLITNIKSITENRKKNIGILVNQDELQPTEFQGFMDMALENYNAGPIIPTNGKTLSMADVPKLKQMNALVIAKPRKPFTDEEKLILDQYIMNGGKTLWMIDAVNAEMDTLFQSKKIMAYSMDINMTDFFFNFGIRITPALVKDFKKTALKRLSVGEIQGNPQYKNFLWPYFPLGIADDDNPITKNINPVKFEFPTSIDTLGRANIKTEILFQSSDRTTEKAVPNYVSLNEIVNADSLGVMERPTRPKIFAVALSGKFQSGYVSRVERESYPDFHSQSSKNKMIIVADGDVGRNAVLRGKALPLGVDLLTNQQYGNAQFLRNGLDWLLDDDNLTLLRNRTIEARLLDRQRIAEEKNYWQWFNLLLPLFLVGGFTGIFFWWRRRKFS